MKPIYKIMFFFSIALTIAAIFLVVILGLRLGVDFKGGSVLEVEFKQKIPDPAELKKVITDLLDLGDVSISPVGASSVIIRMKDIDESRHQTILKRIKNNFGDFEEKRFDSVGPVIGNELRKKSVSAIILVLIAIVVYIAFVFRKLARALSSWVMGFAAIIALLHDIIIPIGVFTILGKYFNVEISAVFVAAVLTILGYSVSDTVVVFDRIRENVLRLGAKTDFSEVVHNSILQTLSRSLNTTFTTLLSLFAIYFFGGETIKFFALALIIGIFLGAYSSIFVASPILVYFRKFSR